MYGLAVSRLFLALLRLLTKSLDELAVFIVLILIMSFRFSLRSRLMSSLLAKGGVRLFSSNNCCYLLLIFSLGVSIVSLTSGSSGMLVTCLRFDFVMKGWNL